MKTTTLNSIKGILFIGISIYLAFTFNDALTNFVTKIPFIGWVKGSIILRIVISFSFARGLQLLFKSFSIRIKSIFVVSIGALLGFTICFIAQPIYNTDYGTFGTTELSIQLDDLKNETTTEFSLNKKPALVVFFSTNCGSCKEMSIKIGELQSMGNAPQIITLFPGTEADALAFMNENGGQNFDYYMIDNDEFFMKTADYSFPSIFLVNGKGETIQHWNGALMNYSAFDLIESYK